MTIEETLGVSKESILAKEHNLWIGLSFGNKWFTSENLKELIKLGLEYTKDSLLILVPGRMHATNLRYFDDLSRAEALRKAFEEEDEKLGEVQDIISNLKEEEQNKIIVAKYDDVLTPTCIKQREELMREFSKQSDFYKLVSEIAQEMLEIRGRTISKERVESAALYVLHELPLFLDGIQKNGVDNVHTVILYPGLGKLDDLVVKILESEQFKSLRERLNITHKTGIASVL